MLTQGTQQGGWAWMILLPRTHIGVTVPKHDMQLTDFHTEGSRCLLDLSKPWSSRCHNEIASFNFYLASVWMCISPLLLTVTEYLMQISLERKEVY